MDISVGSSPLPHQATRNLAIGRLIKLLRRYSWLIVACALISAVGAYLYARNMPKTYTASSAITVGGDRLAIPELQGALRNDSPPDPMPFVRTEVQALTSRTLIQGVVAKLNLSQYPEFNQYLQPPTFMQTITGTIKSFLPHQAESEVKPGPDESVLSAVTKALGVFQDNRSLVIATSFTAEDPRLASDVLNTLITDYIQSRARTRVDATRGANDILVARTAQARADLDAVEQKMTALRSKDELVNLRAGSVGQQQLEDLATAASRASLERSQLESNWNRATSLSKQGMSDALVNVLGSPTISRLRDQESVASRRVAELSSRYGGDYPGVRSARADLGAAHAQVSDEIQRIVSSLGAQVRVAREQETDVQHRLETARQSGVLAENARAQLAQLQQEATSRRAIYQTLLERSQQTVAQPTGFETPDVRVLSAAVPPGSPSGPNTKLIVGMGGISGLILGCLLALTRIGTVEEFDGSAQFARSIGVPVLASIPRALITPGRNGFMNGVLAKPATSTTELARVLRAQIRFAGRSSSPRVVAFTSVGADGAASIVAAAVARIAAADGERVLLIEGNLVTPGLGRLLGSSNTGLSAVLTERADWRDMIDVDDDTRLDLLLTGRRIAGSNTFITSVAFQNLLVEARRDYELIVLDAAAATSSDAAALVQRVDATMLVVDRKARRNDILEAVERLSAASRGSLHAALIV